MMTVARRATPWVVWLALFVTMLALLFIGEEVILQVLGLASAPQAIDCAAPSAKAGLDLGDLFWLATGLILGRAWWGLCDWARWKRIDRAERSVRGRAT